MCWWEYSAYLCGTPLWIQGFVDIESFVVGSSRRVLSGVFSFKEEKNNASRSQLPL